LAIDFTEYCWLYALSASLWKPYSSLNDSKISFGGSLLTELTVAAKCLLLALLVAIAITIKEEALS
jgi:hypothetical protein